MPLVIDEVMIGKSELFTLPLGVGTMAWSNSRFWGYGDRLGTEAASGAFEAALTAGIRLFDTAEIYGGGSSERVLGELLRREAAGSPRSGTRAARRPPVLVATKFAPFPWRFTGRALLAALDRSLSRLGLSEIDLYQIHFPGPGYAAAGLVDALAEAVKSGRARTVGVSNFGVQDMRRAHDRLARQGVPLVSNQVEYSLVERSPEVNGVLDACLDLGVTLIAYSPLGRGVLGGRYGPEAGARDVIRRHVRQFGRHGLAELAPLIEALRELGEEHQGRTTAQIALNWLIRRPGVVAIPGAKSAAQAAQNAATLEFALTDDEIDRLDSLSRRYRGGWS